MHRPCPPSSAQPAPPSCFRKQCALLCARRQPFQAPQAPLPNALRSLLLSQEQRDGLGYLYPRRLPGVPFSWPRRKPISQRARTSPACWRTRKLPWPSQACSRRQLQTSQLQTFPLEQPQALLPRACSQRQTLLPQRRAPSCLRVPTLQPNSSIAFSYLDS